MALLRYSPAVERPDPEEPATFDEIVAAFGSLADKTREQTGRAMRVSHAKATGFLVGELEVSDGLPPELAQGLFKAPGRFPVLARLAQGPGELLPDRVSTHRGIALKILEVDGPKLAESDEQRTQDFVFEAGRTFPDADAASFLVSLKGLSKAPLLSTGVKQAVSTGARAASRVVEALGGESRRLDFLGHPERHPLAESYYSQAPLRFGDFVAKMALVPASPAQQALAQERIDTEQPDAFRQAVRLHCAGAPAVFDLCAQLAVEGDTMPIEDSSVEWPEEDSPYRPVARLTFPPQISYSEARRAFFDESLSFAPTHSLNEHRPLGSVMRARLAVYPVMAAERHARSGAPHVEPSDTAQVPK